ncbi:hypothetical protein MSG28_008273 [Choristoneura fumiferana]|uniref:Uncharacterized protein n=2 Tax=Choristoneura fumiferana TaxID=7141 RepID=A0ACC0JAT7_CHOFU|nr:hypothetical protein MSG28_008273 [Choristoneura fumiferana]KAI8421210.1 hypothetical protein MSG28_008273 [Choristoneura fumiferana]
MSLRAWKACGQRGHWCARAARARRPHAPHAQPPTQPESDGTLANHNAETRLSILTVVLGEMLPQVAGVPEAAAADLAPVGALLSVRQAVFAQRSQVVESFAALCALDVFLMIRRKKLTIFTDAKDTTTLMEDEKTLAEYGLTSATAKAQCPAPIGLAVRKENGEFEALDLTPYSSPPDLPDVMKSQEANGQEQMDQH